MGGEGGCHDDDNQLLGQAAAAAAAAAADWGSTGGGWGLWLLLLQGLSGVRGACTVFHVLAGELSSQGDPGALARLVGSSHTSDRVEWTLKDGVLVALQYGKALQLEASAFTSALPVGGRKESPLLLSGGLLNGD